MAPVKKRGPGRPRTAETSPTYVRLTAKEEKAIKKRITKTGETKAAVIQQAVRAYFNLTQE